MWQRKQMKLISRNLEEHLEPILFIYLFIFNFVCVFSSDIQGTVKDNSLLQEGILVREIKHIYVANLKQRFSSEKMLIWSCLLFRAGQRTKEPSLTSIVVCAQINSYGWFHWFQSNFARCWVPLILRVSN